MNKSTIQTLIDKVIGKKGLIRVPSWWMRKVLMQIADWVQEGDDANNKKIGKVETETDGKISTLNTNVSNLETNLNSEISYLKNLSLPYMLVSGTGVVGINGKVVNFSKADNQLIYITGPISFSRSNIADNQQLTSIVIHNLDVRVQGKSMNKMFARCKNLSSINIIGLYTSAVTDMISMFDTCSNLTSLELTGFDTSAVTYMSNMFSSCSNLTSLDLSNFNTSAVTYMSGMFQNCSKLTALNLLSFNTSAVTNMSYMFYNCKSLISLELSSFDTSAVTDMSYIFNNCPALTSLILGPNFFKTPNVISVDFSSSTKWTNDTVVTSLVTNSYDRATAGLNTMTLKLSTETKAALTDEQKAAITAKGYTIA